MMNANSKQWRVAIVTTLGLDYLNHLESARHNRADEAVRSATQKESVRHNKMTEGQTDLAREQDWNKFIKDYALNKLKVELGQNELALARDKYNLSVDEYNLGKRKQTEHEVTTLESLMRNYYDALQNGSTSLANAYLANMQNIDLWDDYYQFPLTKSKDITRRKEIGEVIGEDAYLRKLTEGFTTWANNVYDNPITDMGKDAIQIVSKLIPALLK